MKADAAKKKRVNWTSLCEEQEHMMGGVFCFTMCKILTFVKEENLAKTIFKGKPNLQWEKFSIDCTEALLDSTSSHFALKVGFGWN